MDLGINMIVIGGEFQIFRIAVQHHDRAKDNNHA
jgi:hypothetical protein